MVKVVIVGDIGIDYDGFLLIKIISGLFNVKFDFMFVVRLGDLLEFYFKFKYLFYGRFILFGFLIVMINGKFVVIIGGSIFCGGVIIGSLLVNIGDLYIFVLSLILSKILYDINVKVKDINGFICLFMEVLCLFDDGLELVMKIDVNGELKGLVKGDKMKKVLVKLNKIKNWLLRDS